MGEKSDSVAFSAHHAASRRCRQLDVFIRTLMHLLDNLIETIIVKNRYLSEEAIREDIRIILDKAK